MNCLYAASLLSTLFFVNFVSASEITKQELFKKFRVSVKDQRPGFPPVLEDCPANVSTEVDSSKPLQLTLVCNEQRVILANVNNKLVRRL